MKVLKVLTMRLPSEIYGHVILPKAEFKKILEPGDTIFKLGKKRILLTEDMVYETEDQGETET